MLDASIIRRKGLTWALVAQTLHIPKTGPWPVTRKWALSHWNILPDRSGFICLKSGATQYQFARQLMLTDVLWRTHVFALGGCSPSSWGWSQRHIMPMWLIANKSLDTKAQVEFSGWQHFACCCHTLIAGKIVSLWLYWQDTETCAWFLLERAQEAFALCWF